jgi:hypothetical protein
VTSVYGPRNIPGRRARWRTIGGMSDLCREFPDPQTLDRFLAADLLAREEPDDEEEDDESDDEDNDEEDGEDDETADDDGYSE